MLPHISYVYKLSKQIVSSNNERAYSICFQTISTIEQRSIKEEWSKTACIGFNSIDSASAATGIEWDNTRNMMVGQCNAHKFQPFTKKFEMLAKKRKAAELAEDGNMEGDKEASTLILLFA